MNRLQLELDRLYGTGAHTADGEVAGAAEAHGRNRVRALVLELALPAGWGQLSAVWKGVQADLELPAAAIAISGVDGLQLWFSLASPVAPQAGRMFLEGLRARYLADVAPKRVRLIAEVPALPAAPPVEISPDHWSAFVTPDLAALFAETPWLDIPPTDDGQAALLRALESIPPAAFDAALATLAATDAEPPPEAPSEPPTSAATALPAAPASERLSADPVRFLASVMNDETAPLALRIEAAKALLPYAATSATSA